MSMSPSVCHSLLRFVVVVLPIFIHFMSHPNYFYYFRFCTDICLSHWQEVFFTCPVNFFTEACLRAYFLDQQVFWWRRRPAIFLLSPTPWLAPKECMKEKHSLPNFCFLLAGRHHHGVLIELELITLSWLDIKGVVFVLTWSWYGKSHRFTSDLWSLGGRGQLPSLPLVTVQWKNLTIVD